MDWWDSNNPLARELKRHNHLFKMCFPLTVIRFSVSPGTMRISLKHLQFSVAWAYIIHTCTRKQLLPWPNKVLRWKCWAIMRQHLWTTQWDCEYVLFFYPFFLSPSIVRQNISIYLFNVCFFYSALQQMKVPSVIYYQLHDFKFDDIQMDDDETLRVR